MDILSAMNESYEKKKNSYVSEDLFKLQEMYVTKYSKQALENMELFFTEPETISNGLIQISGDSIALKETLAMANSNTLKNSKSY